MTNKPKVPNFLWAVIAAVLVVVVAYVLLTGRVVEEVEIPGAFRLKLGDAGTGQGDTVAEEGTEFSIHYKIGADLFQNLEIVSGQADVYLNGVHLGTLRADQRNPFVAVTATVPHPGAYSYELQLLEESLDTLSGQTQTRRYAGGGTIDIEAAKHIAFMASLSHHWKRS